MNSKSLRHLAMIVLLQAASLVPQGIARADVVIVYDEANPEIFERSDAASEEAVTPGELYVASVYEGRIRTDGQLHGPRAKVVLASQQHSYACLLPAASKTWGRLR